MVGAELVRVKDGNIADTTGMRKSAARRLGYSYAIVVAEADSADVSWGREREGSVPQAYQSAVNLVARPSACPPVRLPARLPSCLPFALLMYDKLHEFE